MRPRPSYLTSLVVAASLCVGSRSAAQSVIIASKQDAETAILAEMAAVMVRSGGTDVRLSHSLGGTPVVWQAMLRGEVDIYPEYTGTIAQQILHDPALTDIERLGRALASHGIGITRPLGFANNYALGMSAPRAQALDIRTISDLAAHPNLRFGFSSEFLGRADGWPGLKARYRLSQANVRGLDHQLAYLGLSAGEIDVTDLYTTDAEIRTRSLVALIDDREYFPRYDAVFVYRLDLHKRAPNALTALARLEGRLTQETMIRLNEQAKSRIDPASVAANYLSSAFPWEKAANAGPPETWLDRLRVHTIEHIALVAGAVLASVAIGVPLGIVAARRPQLGAALLAVTGIVQTIPSLALLALMIPLPLIGGTGAKPALIALSLYGLLPVVRNTLTGLRDVPANLREAAAGLGLPPRAILWRVELPMASRAILAGIKTSAVITVGTATLGALIGAGGYGQEILRGVQLSDPARILEGAIPAAVLALLVEGFFTLLERVLVPRGLRLEPAE
jgi:osmoprotectant transport system substrate-binding protein/osmoprotectant transport system permease protein